MYIPKYYAVKDKEMALSFIRKHSFGTLVTVHEGRPIATHLPFMAVKQNNRDYLLGHLAYGNSQRKTFRNGEALAMFQGPHAYVSSSWYSQPNVPTWNYQAVHVYGNLLPLQGEQLEEMLSNMIDTYEAGQKAPISWESIPSHMLQQDLKGIIGFQLEITDIQAAFKLSQNKSTEDTHAVIKELRESENSQDRQVAAAMEELQNLKK
ncbi:FMN-binding negative transcriptional regulator [Bacillus lacus]|uniref:FMN-binding negative transcriptional regulator n=1 Tax=Metabacillus lacus TaxID=1983721 RepID=A0A7X2IWP5_9BACI|nr:FMN-binding negative transcriptional regulator [Metabacillus lacus]MRX71160.1 FMN-binding negative transcriptional regulator [Metabacillus lacus]